MLWNCLSAIRHFWKTIYTGGERWKCNVPNTDMGYNLSLRFSEHCRAFAVDDTSVIVMCSELWAYTYRGSRTGKMWDLPPPIWTLVWRVTGFSEGIGAESCRSFQVRKVCRRNPCKLLHLRSRRRYLMGTQWGRIGWERTSPPTKGVSYNMTLCSQLSWPVSNFSLHPSKLLQQAS